MVHSARKNSCETTGKPPPDDTGSQPQRRTKLVTLDQFETGEEVGAYIYGDTEQFFKDNPEFLLIQREEEQEKAERQIMINNQIREYLNELKSNLSKTQVRILTLLLRSAATIDEIAEVIEPTQSPKITEIMEETQRGRRAVYYQLKRIRKVAYELIEKYPELRHWIKGRK